MPVTHDQLKAAIRAQPFKPFRVHLSDQRAFEVPHPEFALLHPNGRMLVVAMVGRDAVEMIDLLHIVSMSQADPPASGTQGLSLA